MRKGKPMEENIKKAENFEDLEPLKKFDLDELHRRQALLDAKFMQKKTENEKTEDALVDAYICELGELLQELKPRWNWWKTKNLTPPDKAKVLEEMSDVLHFYLSWYKKEDFWKKGSLSPYNYQDMIKDDKEAGVILAQLWSQPAKKMFGAMLVIAECVGASEAEFLEVHHKKSLKNWTVRSTENY